MRRFYKKTAFTFLSVIIAVCAALAAGFAVANLGRGAVAHADIDDITETVYWGIGYDGDENALIIHDGVDFEESGFTEYGSFAGTQVFASASEVPWNGKDIHTATVASVIIPLSTAYWFSGLTDLETLDLDFLDTTEVTGVANMLSGLTALKSIIIGYELSVTMGDKDTGLNRALYTDCTDSVAPSGGLYADLESGEYYTSAHHELPFVDAEPATCSTNGNIEHYFCDVCEKAFSDEDGTTEINDVSTALDPENHTWGDWQEVTAATCSAKGSEARICGGCNNTDTRETDIDPDNHSWEHVNGKEPTETEDGYTEHDKCTLCDTTKDKEVLPATGSGSGGGSTGGNTGSGSTSFGQSNSMNSKTMLILLAAGVGVVTLMAVFALILAVRKKTEGAAADDDGFYDDYRE